MTSEDADVWEARHQAGHVATKPLGLAIQAALLRTPSAQEPGVTAERLVTKEGEPAKIGERAHDKNTGRLAQVGLTQQLQMLLPTPRTTDSAGGLRPNDGEHRIGANGEKWGLNLSDKIALLPTPNASAAKDRGGMDNPCIQRRVAMGKQVDLNMTISGQTGPGTGAKLRLTPAFTEWMMGYPEGWLDFPTASREAIELYRVGKKGKSSSAEASGGSQPSKPTETP